MTDGPALRTLSQAIRDLAHPFAAWISEAVPAAGGYDPLPEIVAEAEAEGARLIGALPCPEPHGMADEHDPENVLFALTTCPACGARV